MEDSLTVTKEEKIARFGYDPEERLRFIGVAGAIHEGKLDYFDFYYHASSRRIDVCYSGCNGTYRCGLETSDTETSLTPEFSKAFFEVKARVPPGYRFEEKPWIGRIVTSIKDLPIEYRHCTGPIHFDIYYEANSGSIDIHIVGSCCPMFRGIIRSDGSTTLPPELQEICRDLSLKPQLSIDEHNTSCEECLVAIQKSSQRNRFRVD